MSSGIKLSVRPKSHMRDIMCIPDCKTISKATMVRADSLYSAVNKAIKGKGRKLTDKEEERLKDILI